MTSFLARMSGGGWLSAEEADSLLRCYGLPMVTFRRAADAGAANEAANGFGGHVVIKADVPGLLHKTAAGAVELDLHGADEVGAAMRRLQDRFAGRMNGVIVEPMIPGGIETIVGVVQEPVFGPVVPPGRRHRRGRAHPRQQPPAGRPVRAPASRVPAWLIAGDLGPRIRGRSALTSRARRE